MKTSTPALIIIDMQQGMRSPAAGPRNNPQAEANILRLLRQWRDADACIVHVRHMSRTPGSLFWPGQSGAEFQPELAPLDSEYVMEKNVPDAFIHSTLEKWLRLRAIEQLIIVGVSTNNSVEATARTAGNLHFDTYVVSDATYAYELTDFDGRHRSAQEVHAMALANLQADYARIIDTAAALQHCGSVART